MWSPLDKNPGVNKVYVDRDDLRALLAAYTNARERPDNPYQPDERAKRIEKLLKDSE